MYKENLNKLLLLIIYAVVVTGCDTFSYKRYNVSFHPQSQYARIELIGELEAVKEMIDPVIEREDMMPHKPDIWRNSLGVEVALTENTDGGIMLEIYAFGGGPQVRSVNRMEKSLLNELSLYSNVLIVEDVTQRSITDALENNSETN